MKINTIRAIIAIIFMVCFMACFIALVATQLHGLVRWQATMSVLKAVIPLYMTPIGVILGVTLGKKALSQGSETKSEADNPVLPVFQGLFAISSVIIWNTLILFMFWQFSQGKGNEKILISYLTDVIPLAAPLFSVIIAAFFSD